MYHEEIEILKRDLKNHLSERRYAHSLRVMDKAEEYAKIYKQDVDIVKITALAHDLAKEFTEDENQNYVLSNHLDEKLLQKENLPLLHGFIAADILEKEYSFSNMMGDAVRYHTTGRKNMTILDKIIFLADKTEDARKFVNIEMEQELSKIDLDQAMIFSLENSIRRLQKLGKPVHKMSIDALILLKEKDFNHNYM